MPYASGTVTLSAVNATVTPPISQASAGNYTFWTSGVAGSSIVAEVSIDCSVWFPMTVMPFSPYTSPPAAQLSVTSDNLYAVQCAGMPYVRLRVATYGGAPITVSLYGSDSFGPAMTINTVPTGNAMALAPANYTSVSASGSTTIKSSAGTVYAVYNTAASTLVSTFTLKDGTVTVIPSNALLNASPSGLSFGPSGAQFNNSIVVTLGGLLSSPVLILWR